MITIAFALALACYLGAGSVLAASLLSRHPSAPRSGTVLVGAGVAAHAAGVAAYAVRFGELPLVGLAPVLSMLSLLIAAFLLAAALLGGARPLGLVLAPLAAAPLAVALALGARPAGEPLAFHGFWFGVHVTLGVVGYAGLATAFAAGLLYLLQFRELTGKHFGRLFRFCPSLETLDGLGRRALAIGFPALTLSLLVGWGWAVRFRYLLDVTDPKVIWGVLTWVVFAAALTAGAGRGRRDRRAALASVLGFVVVVVAYLVLRLSMAEGRWFL